MYVYLYYKEVWNKQLTPCRNQFPTITNVIKEKDIVQTTDFVGDCDSTD